MSFCRSFCRCCVPRLNEHDFRMSVEDFDDEYTEKAEEVFKPPVWSILCANGDRFLYSTSNIVHLVQIQSDENDVEISLDKEEIMCSAQLIDMQQEYIVGGRRKRAYLLSSNLKEYEILEGQHNFPIMGVGCTKEMLWTGGRDGYVILYEKTEGHEVVMQHSVNRHVVTDMKVLSYDRDQVLTSGEDKRIIMWTPFNQEREFSFGMHYPNRLAVINSSLFVAGYNGSSGSGGELVLFDIEQDKAVDHIAPLHGRVNGLCVVDGHSVVAAYNTGTVVHWNTETGAVSRHDTSTPLLSIGFNSPTSTFALGTANFGTIYRSYNEIVG
ncbi:hypothetical protein PCE1_003012 [Barthelona sp. PCE]